MWIYYFYLIYEYKVHEYISQIYLFQNRRIVLQIYIYTIIIHISIYYMNVNPNAVVAPAQSIFRKTRPIPKQ